MREFETIQDYAAQVGKEIGISDWLLVDQDRINKFADATGDHQWIHVDVERAKKDMPGGKTIAHGYLTLSLIPFLTKKIAKVKKVSRGINYGSNKVRFTSPVPAGARVRARQKLVAAEPVQGNGMRFTNEITIEIEGQDRPACVAEVMAIQYA